MRYFIVIRFASSGEIVISSTPGVSIEIEKPLSFGMIVIMEVSVSSVTLLALPEYLSVCIFIVLVVLVFIQASA